MSRSSRSTLGVWVSVAACAAIACVWSARVAGQAPAPAAQQAPPAAPQDAPAAVPQQPPAPTVVVPNTVPVTTGTDGGKLNLIAGRSMVLTTDYDIRRFSFTNVTVADGTAVSPRELLIDGKTAGTISLIVWGDTRRVQYELVVEPSITTLEQRLHELFPGEDINVSVSEGAVILSGHASTNEVMLRAAEIAGTSLPNQHVINMLQLPGGTQSKQVMLQVRFAEVNRTAVENLGINLFATRSNFTALSTTQQFSAPTFTQTPGQPTTTTFSDFLNLFFFQQNQGIGGVMAALKQTGDIQSLAEPNLIAYDGKQASFLAGGEFPVPVVSGASGTVSVSYKEFGVRLTFTPTIAGDVIRLHLRPEVSTLDFPDGVTISGFRIPALTERWAETEVELRDGQSFAIAGLLNNVDQINRAAIPLLSQIPVIGPIFKSRQNNKNQTELLVLITPRLVRPLNPDEVPPLPTLTSPSTPGSPTNTPVPGGSAGRVGGGTGLLDGPSLGSGRTK